MVGGVLLEGSPKGFFWSGILSPFRKKRAFHLMRFSTLSTFSIKFLNGSPNYSNVQISLKSIYMYISSERNHQVADKFRKMSCLNVYGRKRGRVGVKQCMHSFHSLDCLLSVFFDDYMLKLYPIFYLANFVCFYPSKFKTFFV